MRGGLAVGILAFTLVWGAGAGAAADRGADRAPLRLTLADSVARALSETPDARALDARLAQQTAGVRIALAAILPQASLTATYTHYDQAVSFGGSSVVIQDEAGVRGDLGVSLFRPRALGDWLTARGDLVAARTQTGFDRAALALATVEVFLGVLRAGALVEAAADTLARREAFVEAAERRLSLGLTDRSEVQRARLSLLVARAEHVRLVADEAVARESLAALLALPPGAPVELVDEDRSLAAATPTPDAAEASAGDRRLDVRALRQILERDETARTWAWLDFLPDLELAAGFTQGPSTFRDPDGFAWQIQLRAVFTLYDGGARYGRIDRTAAVQAADEAAVDAVRAQVAEEVRTARLRVAQRGVELNLAGETVDLARQVRSDTERRLEAGLATLLDVLSADDQLAAAQLRVRSTAYDLRVARWQLAHAAGTLVEALRP